MSSILGYFSYLLRFAQKYGGDFVFFDVYKALCDAKGVSYKRAAMEIGLSNSVTAKWKNGAMPNGSTLTKIADYFGTSIDELLGTETEKTPTLLVEDGLDEQEQRMIRAARRLDPSQKILLLALVESVVERTSVLQAR